LNEQRIKFGPENVVKTRLDIFLAQRIPELSRARIQSLIKTGHVWVAGINRIKPGFIYDGQTEIEVEIPAVIPTTLPAEHVHLDILYENKDVLVINKPAGMVVHPSAGHSQGTLVNAILGYIPDLEGIGGEQRPGIVHRLDKDTSGIILVAKNDSAHHWLQSQFKKRDVVKTYLALVDGGPPTPSGRIDAPIGRDPIHRKKMAIVKHEKGREAVSEYCEVEKFSNHSLLEFHPLTGRTHQIRLHCALIGCPITGDRVYGKKKPTIELDRHFLHAIGLKILLPGEADPHEFTAPLPDELKSVLARLRISENLIR